MNKLYVCLYIMYIYNIIITMTKDNIMDKDNHG